MVSEDNRNCRTLKKDEGYVVDASNRVTLMLMLFYVVAYAL